MATPRARLAGAGLTWVCLLGGIGLAAAPDPEGSGSADALMQPARVRLDFHDRPLGEVAEAIGRRAGRSVRLVNQLGGRQADWRLRKVTLEAPEPVAFWEAIDRLCEAGRTGRRVAQQGAGPGETSTFVAIEEAGPPQGRPLYAGPFRVALIAVHEHRDADLVRGPWVLVNPSGYPSPAAPGALGSAPADGGPLYAELQVLAEPGLLCRRCGPLAGLEAEDERERSLLDPAWAERSRAAPEQAAFFAGLGPPLRIPLRRPDERSRSIRRLAGAIPLEFGRRSREPSLVVPLDEPPGKTHRAGEIAFELRRAGPLPDGRLRFELAGQVVGEASPAVRSARMSLLVAHQLLVVDAKGAAVRFASSSTSLDGGGGTVLAFDYAPATSPGTGPPAEFRAFELERIAREIPFQFRDVPLP